jgi:hypothetical protein
MWRARRVGNSRGQKGRMFFFKKRTKKLLSIKGSAKSAHLNYMLAAMSKSFLVLF